MLRLWFSGVPWRCLNPKKVEDLFDELAAAAEVSIDDVEVFIETTQYLMLKRDGTTELPWQVHVRIECEKKDPGTKKALSEAIDKFWRLHGLPVDIDHITVSLETTTVADKGIGTEL